MAETYGISKATELAGFDSTAMVNYLCNQKLVKPIQRGSRGRGKRRYFDIKGVLLLKIIKKLLDQGITVSKLKKAFEELHKLKVDEYSLIHGDNAANYLATDGNNVYFRRTAKEIIDLNHEGQFVFSFLIIKLDRIRDELYKDL